MGLLVEVKDALEAADWHRLLAIRDLELDPVRPDAQHFAYRYWRWNGHLIRYATTEAAMADDAKEDGGDMALVMVHGFGASADQWHRLIEELLLDRPAPGSSWSPPTRMFALDMLGFGHSEKPVVSYTQYMWEDLVRDFVLEVVRRPAILVGNSIGGYVATSAAAALGDYCAGLVLCNSAGPLLSRKEYEQELANAGGASIRQLCEEGRIPHKSAPPQWLLEFGGSALISVLRSNVPSFCRKVYPNKPDAVDDRLVNNIVRDSLDPGGYSVIASGAKLPQSRSKNELLEEFAGPLLVAQGLNDPLGGGISRVRFGLYPEAHPHGQEAVELVGLEAGHCPHHESPSEVASAIRDFAARPAVLRRAMAAAGDAFLPAPVQAAAS